MEPCSIYTCLNDALYTDVNGNYLCADCIDTSENTKYIYVSEEEYITLYTKDIVVINATTILDTNKRITYHLEHLDSPREGALGFKESVKALERLIESEKSLHCKIIKITKHKECIDTIYVTKYK